MGAGGTTSAAGASLVSDLLIVIGNKKYSSWSLRGWIGVYSLGVPFREQRIPLYLANSQTEILKFSPAGHVPILVDDGLTVHDSLAILEYLNETHANGKLLPAGRADRALCRSVSAEMHAGFVAVRQALSMNLARKPGPVPLSEQVRQEIRRILTMWEELRGAHKGAGPYLFGTFSLADCMYLPVATRFQTYEVDLTSFPRARAYADTLLALPGFLEWKQAALKETEVAPGDEG